MLKEIAERLREPNEAGLFIEKCTGYLDLILEQLGVYDRRSNYQAHA